MITRENSIKSIDTNRGGDFWTSSQVKARVAIEQINLIFDDFESRTCENCEFYVEYEENEFFNESGDGECSNQNVLVLSTEENFGCNKFKRETKC